MASLRSPRLLLHFKIQLLPPPVPGLSLGKAPAKVFPTRRTLGLGVLDQKWWAHPHQIHLTFQHEFFHIYSMENNRAMKVILKLHDKMHAYFKYEKVHLV